MELTREIYWNIGNGAGVLIPMYALHKGLNFRKFDGLAGGPMAQGEDRHFCAWAARLHIPLVADAWPDIYHAYHPQNYPDIASQIERLARMQNPPKFGDLVSAKIELVTNHPQVRSKLAAVDDRYFDDAVWLG